MLQFYVEVARTAFRRQLIYNWANLAGLLTNIVFGVIFSYVMIALYQVKHLAGGYDLNDALRYVWLVQALAALGRLYERPWFNLGDRDLATHLYRTERLRAGDGQVPRNGDVRAGEGPGERAAREGEVAGDART